MTDSEVVISAEFTADADEVLFLLPDMAEVRSIYLSVPDVTDF